MTLRLTLNVRVVDASMEPGYVMEKQTVSMVATKEATAHAQMTNLHVKTVISVSQRTTLAITSLTVMMAAMKVQTAPVILKLNSSVTTEHASTALGSVMGNRIASITVTKLAASQLRRQQKVELSSIVAFEKHLHTGLLISRMLEGDL